MGFADPSRPSLPSEGALAALLASLLANDGFWARFDERPDDETWRSEMGDLAVALYRQTHPILEEIAFAESETPAHRAIGAVWEIANGCALRSELWAKFPRDEEAILSREQVELEIWLVDVAEWAAGLGWPLQFATGPSVTKVEHAIASSSGWGPDEWTPDTAVALAVDLAAYTSMLEVQEALKNNDLPDVVARVSSRQFRVRACRRIADARRWVVWSRGHVDVRQGEVAANIMQWLAHATFVFTREPTSELPLYPTTSFLSAVLERTGTAEWMTQQGADLPEWYQPE